jgi:hypothetical protein
MHPISDDRIYGELRALCRHRHRIFLMHSRNQVNGSRYWRTERRLSLAPLREALAGKDFCVVDMSLLSSMRETQTPKAAQRLAMLPCGRLSELGCTFVRRYASQLRQAFDQPRADGDRSVSANGPLPAHAKPRTRSTTVSAAATRSLAISSYSADLAQVMNASRSGKAITMTLSLCHCLRLPRAARLRPATARRTW